MLIRIPDEYQAMEILLRRNGIPFEILDEEEVIESIAEKVNFFNSLNKSKLEELIRQIISE
jgi:hypothetical protein